MDVTLDLYSAIIVLIIGVKLPGGDLLKLIPPYLCIIFTQIK